MEALRQQVAALDALIRQHLPSAPSAADARPASLPTGSIVPLEGTPRKGDQRARVAVVEFSDYHCPYCSNFARTTLAELDKRYVATGKIQYAFMDFPIASLHPDALPAHRAAACAGDQGRYWEMHEQLFTGGPASGSALGARARQATLDGRKFDECLSSDRHMAAVQGRIALGQKLGVRGTPTFLLGEIDASGQFTAKRVITGAQPLESFETAIDGLLAASRP